MLVSIKMLYKEIIEDDPLFQCIRCDEIFDHAGAIDEKGYCDNCGEIIERIEREIG